MGVSRTYRKSAERAIASYSFTDIVTGTGIVTFYPFVGRDNSAAIYRMDSTAQYSELIEKTFGLTENATPARYVNISWDTKKYNLAQTLRGTALFTLPLEINPRVSNQVWNSYWIVTVYTWDGTTETEIATITSDTFTAEAGVSTQKIFQVELNIPNTIIKQEEQIRVTTELWAYMSVGSGGGTTFAAVGTDPKNRDGSTITVSDNIITQMALNLPFKVDL